MNKKSLLLLSIGAAMVAPSIGAEVTYTSTFNVANVILPASQWTPDDPYKADVWVVNTGKRYEGPQGTDNENYNKVWDTPANDANGNAWYAPAYQLTGKDGNEWTEGAQAPFSSDAVYKNHNSFQWVTNDIMGDMFMRRSFTVSKPILKNVFLACGSDDAPSEWYINGVQVFTVADGWNNDRTYLLTDEQKALIKTDGSENIIAVHVHQNWGGAFADCGLYEADMYETNIFLPNRKEVESGYWACSYMFPESNEALGALDLGWTAINFDDSAWEHGNGPFSNDQADYTFWDSNNVPILIRREFNMAATDLNGLDAANIKFTCSYDEYPKVYLNGTLIWSAERWNDNNYAEYVLSAADKALLVEGKNVLAVSLQQGGGGGHIDFGLQSFKYYVPGGVTNEMVQEKLDQLNDLIEKLEAVKGNNALVNAIDAANAEIAKAAKQDNEDALTTLREAYEVLFPYLAEFTNAQKTMDMYAQVKAKCGSADITFAEEKFANAKTNGDFQEALKQLRYDRRRAAADRHDDVFAGNVPAEGKFYLYNVGQKQFLCGGSDWGAHAALGFPGLEIALEPLEGDETGAVYAIETGLYNGDNHYLNSRGYMDAGRAYFYFKPVEGKENVYYIFQHDWRDACVVFNPFAGTDGNNTDETTVSAEQRGLFNGQSEIRPDYNPDNNPYFRNIENAQWKLVTKAERDALIEQASLKNPVDLTYRIASPNFNQREDARFHWQMVENSEQGFNAARYGENCYDFVAETWNSPADSELTQSLEDLPAGIYTVELQGFYRNGKHHVQPGAETTQNIIAYANDEEVALPNITAAANFCPGEGDEAIEKEIVTKTDAEGNEYTEEIDKVDGNRYFAPNSVVQATQYFKVGAYKTHLTVEVEEGMPLVIGAYKAEVGNAEDWGVVDNFRLKYYGNNTTKEEVEGELDGIEDIIAAPAQTDNRIFNLQGIEVKNPSAPGIYIQGGKKFIVR